MDAQRERDCVVVLAEREVVVPPRTPDVDVLDGAGLGAEEVVGQDVRGGRVHVEPGRVDVGKLDPLGWVIHVPVSTRDNRECKNEDGSEHERLPDHASLPTVEPSSRTRVMPGRRPKPNRSRHATAAICHRSSTGLRASSGHGVRSMNGFEEHCSTKLTIPQVQQPCSRPCAAHY